MSTTDELLRNAEEYAAEFDKGGLPLPPAKKVAIVACMDARIVPSRLLGIHEGDAHVIRNAGGSVAEEEIRSLAISQNLLGTEEIIVIQHTDCGMLTFDDQQFSDQLKQSTGLRPSWPARAFPDVEENVRDSIARIQASPFIPKKNVRGFIYDVETAQLTEVT